MPHHKCVYRSVEEEQEARQNATTEQIRVFRSKLPILLKRLSKIDDPRNSKKVGRRKGTFVPSVLDWKVEGDHSSRACAGFAD